MMPIPLVQSAGAPRFMLPGPARRAASDGVAAAWCEAAETGLARAVVDVSGDYSVALQHEGGAAELAVDRFAIQPLCYRVVNGTLRWAARADALADHQTEIDPQAIFDYLFFHTIPAPRTIFKGIYRLPAAHSAHFKDGKMEVKPYWIPAFRADPDRSYLSLRTEFLRLLRASVASQLDGGQAACYLSGGTDSSTVAGLIGEVTGQPATAYSIGFAAAGYDEMMFAKIAARHFGCIHHTYYVTPEDLVHSIAKVASHYDQPFGNSSALPAYYCAAQARDHGATRLLAGDGGDELFGGNSRYATQRLLDWYGAVPRALRSAVLEPTLGLPALQGLPLVRKASSYVAQAKAPLPGRLNRYNLLQQLGVEAVCTPDFLQQVDPQAPQVQQDLAWALPSADNALQRHLAFDWRYTLAENDLPKVCGTTRLAGIGVGFPLLDQDLLNFAMRLPASYQLRGLSLRWFFKQALRGFLPEEIIRKKKQGFGLPFGVWACRHAGLNQLARDSLRSLGQRGVIRPDFIRPLLSERLPEHPGYYGEMVWIMMMLEQWLRAHAPNYRL